MRKEKKEHLRHMEIGELYRVEADMAFSMNPGYIELWPGGQRLGSGRVVRMPRGAIVVVLAIDYFRLCYTGIEYIAQHVLLPDGKIGYRIRSANSSEKKLLSDENYNSSGEVLGEYGEI